MIAFYRLTLPFANDVALLLNHFAFIEQQVSDAILVSIMHYTLQ